MYDHGALLQELLTDRATPSRLTLLFLLADKVGGAPGQRRRSSDGAERRKQKNRHRNFWKPR